MAALRSAQDRDVDGGLAAVLGDFHAGEGHGGNAGILHLARNDIDDKLLLNDGGEAELCVSNPSDVSLAVQRSGDQVDLIGLDDVAWLEIVIILDADTALEAGGDFFRVVFEALERGHFAFVDHARIAEQSDVGATEDLAVDDRRYRRSRRSSVR